MPGHECFDCRAKPDGHARATISKYLGTKGAYWTCRCGAWTFINGPTAKDPNATKQKRDNAQGPRGADGRAPTKPVLGDWQVVSRRKLRRPRTDADEREPLPAPAAKHLPAAQAMEVDDDMPEHDEAVAVQDDDEEQDEEAITKLVTQLELVKGDAAADELCGRYKEKLRRLREANAAPRNPALLPLRAQRTTKRRAKRGEAARERVRRLEAKVEELLAETEEARKEVQEAEEAEVEARRQEDAYREEIAAAKAGDAEGRHGHEDTVRGLRLQVAALPEAIRSGNADAAQRAIWPSSSTHWPWAWRSGPELLPGGGRRQRPGRALGRRPARPSGGRRARRPGHPTARRPPGVRRNGRRRGPTIRRPQGGARARRPRAMTGRAAPPGRQGTAGGAALPRLLTAARTRASEGPGLGAQMLGQGSAAGMRGRRDSSPWTGGPSAARDRRGSPPGRRGSGADEGRMGYAVRGPGARWWTCPIPGAARRAVPTGRLMEAVATDECSLSRLQLPLVTRMALERMVPTRLDGLAAVQLYTDGSGGSKPRRPRPDATAASDTATPAVPAWAMVAVGVLADGSRCLLGVGAAPMPGFAAGAAHDAGRPREDADAQAYDALHMGETTGRSSFAAELFAALWALLWVDELLRVMDKGGTRVGLHSDAMVGVAIAGGSAGSNAEGNLAGALRGAALRAWERRPAEASTAGTSSATWGTLSMSSRTAQPRRQAKGSGSHSSNPAAWASS